MSEIQRLKTLLGSYPGDEGLKEKYFRLCSRKQYDLYDFIWGLSFQPNGWDSILSHSKNLEWDPEFSMELLDRYNPYRPFSMHLNPVLYRYVNDLQVGAINSYLYEKMKPPLDSFRNLKKLHLCYPDDNHFLSFRKQPFRVSYH